MANELDKTIEELEAEVLDELEEVNGADAPEVRSVKAEPMDKVKGKTPGGRSRRYWCCCCRPNAKRRVAKKVAAKAKEVTGDAQQKGEGAPDKMQKLAAGHEPEGEEELSEMEKMEMMKKEMAKMTKSEMAAKMQEMMKGAKKEQLMAMYNGMQKEMSHKEESEEDKAKTEAVENRLKSIDVSEHVEALMTGEGDLSEEFKRKAATVFEAAVKSKVRSEVERMEEDYKNELEENINTTKEDLTEKVDTYLNYVVGLKQLFEDPYVDIMNEKYDVLQD